MKTTKGFRKIRMDPAGNSETIWPADILATLQNLSIVLSFDVSAGDVAD